MKKLKGLSASPGYAIGPAFLLSQKDESPSLWEKGETALEILNEAKQKLGKELEKNVKETGKEGEIFFAHSLLLEDPEIWERVEAKIRAGSTLGGALEETRDEIVSLFESLRDERFKSRAEDVKDVMGRLVERLSESKKEDIPPAAIIVAEEILPSHILSLGRSNPKGFISEMGSPFAHSAIMARARGIPMITACRGISGVLKNGDMVILEGEKGEVIVRPSQRVLREYKRKIREKQMEEEEAFTKRFLPAITRSGRRIKVYANIGSREEIEEAREMGAEGIGIFRTEFLLFEEGKALNKEEHLEVYKKAGNTFYSLPVHIRLFDIGADKPLSFLQLPQEPNPALGLRGIRLLLRRREILLSQLEAIKEAHREYPNLSIILPMVSFVEEIKAIKKIAGDVSLGIMVETPACAILAPQMAELADFLSIGTNDLLQYTLAVDRAGKEVADLFNPRHPALWKLITMSIKGARRRGKEVGVCGEIAGEKAFIPRLVKMGVEHLSVSPRFIPIVKHIIRSLP